MNSYHKTIIVFGVVLLLMPLIAVPYVWKGALAALLGAGVIIGVILEHRAASHNNTL